MKKFFYYILLFFSLGLFAQNEQLAQNYFDKGDFEKALISYEELLKNQSSNWLYFQKVIECYQQLSRFDKAEKSLMARIEKYNQPNLLVELGYNYQLQKNDVEAQKKYEKALDEITKNPSNVYAIAAVFERKVILDYALKAYELGAKLEPNFNFNYPIGVIYGQLGKTDLMIEKFLDEAYRNRVSSIQIQNQLSRFMSEEEGEASFNIALKKALLLRAQKDQDVFWNEYLSWFFVQQKDYSKAFVQEKAIYKRNPETFNNIVNLAQLAMEEQDESTASAIFSFVLENTQDTELKVQAHTFLMQMKTDKASEKDFLIVNSELDLLLKEFGISPYSLPLQLLQAHFITFIGNNPEQGKTILKTALDLPLNKYQVAEVKMELGDILLFEEKFNQALIYY
jgi:Tfp pilus assembly protein PilF